MAKSKSKKMLNHKLKNGMNIDPRNRRGDFGTINGVSKATPTLVEKQRRKENKHKKRDRYDREFANHIYFLFSIKLIFKNSLQNMRYMI